jgi:hypothetical protein
VAIGHAPGFTDYVPSGDCAGSYHEAGYDAFMTGAIMAKVPGGQLAAGAGCWGWLLGLTAGADCWG